MRYDHLGPLFVVPNSRFLRSSVTPIQCSSPAALFASFPWIVFRLPARYPLAPFYASSRISSTQIRLKSSLRSLYVLLCIGIRPRPILKSIKHVGVKANVVDIRTGTEQMTNDFRFTWCREDGEPLKRTVVPMTYQGDAAPLLFTHYRSVKVNDNLQRQCGGSRASVLLT